jgi:DNA-binding MarR family transcriptional regulator
MQEVLDGHLFNSADWRLARALLANFDPKPDAILLRREAAPSKLAELIGVSRTHVHRLINQFQLAGLMTRVEQFSNQ